MGIFDFLFKKPNKATRTSDTAKPKSSAQTKKTEETHKVAGVSFRQEAIKSLGVANPNYKLNKSDFIKLGLENKPVYEYNFNCKKVELVEEPTNEYDPNAVMVIINEVHVGYIKKGSCARIKKLLHTGAIKSLSATISGGNMKMLCCYDDARDTASYSLEKSKKDFYISINIKLK